MAVTELYRVLDRSSRLGIYGICERFHEAEPDRLREVAARPRSVPSRRDSAPRDRRATEGSRDEAQAGISLAALTRPKAW